MVGAMMSHFSISKLSHADLHITVLDSEQEVQMVLNTRRGILTQVRRVCPHTRHRRVNVADLHPMGTAGSTETWWGIAYLLLYFYFERIQNMLVYLISKKIIYDVFSSIYSVTPNSPLQ